MTKNIEVFENEEAERFLDYFVAYKKIAVLIDNVKRMAKVNGEISINNKEPTLPNVIIAEINYSNFPTAIPTPFDK
jgi:hypothetical protein